MAYFWYRCTGSTVWHGAQADQRDTVLRDLHPEYVTVLDASESPQGDWTREDYMKMKYSGPLYFDWDSSDLPKAIKDFQSTLAELQATYRLNLLACRLYATGGRGFHLEVPQAALIAKPTKAGLAHLPHIYREVALKLATDSLDLKVYSGKSGRMWRCPNVNRNTGTDEAPRYKVQITLEEAQAMTPELYDSLCSAQRLPPLTDEPTLCLGLNNLFIECKDKVDKVMARAAKTKDESPALKKFNGAPPAGLKLLMAGMHLNPEQGFNNIALQLAITAHALGMDEAAFIEATEGLSKTHAGDGNRYSSPARRKEALRDRFYYVQGTAAYVFSYGGLRSICEDGFAPTELAPADSMPGDDDGMAPDNVDDEANVPLTAEQELALKAAELTLLEGVRVTANGILRRTPDGLVKISDLVIYSPSLMINTDTDTIVGIECDVARRNSKGLNKLGRHVIAMDVFNSRQSFEGFASSVGCIFKGTDIHATIVRNILSTTATEKDRQTFGVPYEGLSLIQNPRTKGKQDLVPVWVGHGDRPIITRRSISAEMRQAYGDDPDEDYSADPSTSELKFRPTYSKTAKFETDLADAPDLEPTPEFERWFDALLQMNEPIVMAQMLGWTVACFHRAYYDKMIRQFPILFVTGTAGAGKSETVRLLMRMHYSAAREAPASVQCNSFTAMTGKQYLSTSSSVPIILDEYKLRSMNEGQKRFVDAALHNAYNSANGASGGVKDGTAKGDFRDSVEYAYRTPIAILGESINETVAIQQRSVQVGFKTSSQEGRDAAYRLAVDMDNTKHIASIGFSLMIASLLLKMPDLKARYERQFQRAKEGVKGGVNDRQVSNLAVLMTSLEFLKDVLNMRGIASFDDKLDTLSNALFDSRHDTVQKLVVSEEYKALADISHLSRLDVDMPMCIKEGQEYIVGDGFVELDIRAVFVKYQHWSRQQGVAPFYPTTDAFAVAVVKMGAVLDKTCAASQIKRSAATRVYRFDSRKLLEAGVEPFKSRTGL